MNLDNVCVILPISGNRCCIPTISSNIKLDRVSSIFTINIKDIINCPRANTRRQLQFRFSSIILMDIMFVYLRDLIFVYLTDYVSRNALIYNIYAIV